MKLSDHTNHIRLITLQAIENRLGRLGINQDPTDAVPNLNSEQERERLRFLEVLKSLEEEMGTYAKGYEKLADELTFTLFNRIAALKVMEAHTLIPEIITQRPENGNRSFSHSAYLEQYPEKRDEEQEGLADFLSYEFDQQAKNLPLYSLEHYYHLMPTALELKEIIDAFNAVEKDEKDIEPNIWQSDDVLGWLYESYNNEKKIEHKKSKAKTEYDKVSLQSQWYTPKWVVKFLVDNSLGKQYLEMHPDSEIKNKYAIANAPTERIRELKLLTDIKLIDPAPGSGNFLLYAFDVFYDLYIDQIENYGADYEERIIPQLIIEHNLYGVDLDNRAVQIAQLGLYIKAKRKKRNAKINHYNVVSSDFILPEYEAVKYIFNPEGKLKDELEGVVIKLWDDLRQAHKFGALIRIEEIMEHHLSSLESRYSRDLFSNETLEHYDDFRASFINDLRRAVAKHSSSGAYNFMHVQAENAVTYLDILTNKYDVAVANPPYTDSADFGPELKMFIDKNYKRPYNFSTNLYAAFIKRCCELTTNYGKIAMVHPPTFMYIKTFEDVRKFIIDKTSIDLFVEWGYLGMFHPSARVDAAMYILNKEKNNQQVQFIKLNDIYEGHRYSKFLDVYNDIIIKKDNEHVFFLNQNKLKAIDSWPIIYWISDEFRQKFGNKSINDVLNPRQGIATGSNERCVRLWWEVELEDISTNTGDNKKWKNYAKGGPFKKWYGNNWALIDYSEEGYHFLNNNGNHLPSKQFYFQEACTYSASGSKGVSFRYLESNSLFDVGGSCIFMGDYKNPYYTLALLNSHLTFYIAKCFNPTVNTQVGDIKRLPFIIPNRNLEGIVESLVKLNIEKIKDLNKKSIYEREFELTAIVPNQQPIKKQIENFIVENISTEAFIIFNEYVLNELIFDEYDLKNNDREDVENSFGKLLGGLPLTKDAKENFLNTFNLTELQSEFLNKIEVIDSVPEFNLDEFETLYNSNANVEELCKRLVINPINVLYLFLQNPLLPFKKCKDVALEFITNNIRTILTNDDDGIIPLFHQNLESRLLDRLIDHLHQQYFTSAQIAELDQFFGKPLEKYLEENFFNDLSNHLNLFMYLPKTPFIWHLSSGKQKAFEVYISIYQWKRDSLFKLKSIYIAKRREQLQLRQFDLKDADSAAAQAEKELLSYQLPELDVFEQKIDELIAENYDPILDSGVAKNISALQKKGILKAEVLNEKELTKYLKADW